MFWRIGPVRWFSFNQSHFNIRNPFCPGNWTDKIFTDSRRCQPCFLALESSHSDLHVSVKGSLCPRRRLIGKFHGRNCFQREIAVYRCDVSSLLKEEMKFWKHVTCQFHSMGFLNVHAASSVQLACVSLLWLMRNSLLISPLSPLCPILFSGPYVPRATLVWILCQLHVGPHCSGSEMCR